MLKIFFNLEKLTFPTQRIFTLTENSKAMRETLFLFSIIFLFTSNLFAQDLLEANVFEDGSFKTFVYQDQSKQIFGEWYIYNSPLDSTLFAFGPIAVSSEDDKFVQNGTWTYNNMGQIAKKVSYVLGDEHSSGLRSNYHVGQSYFPITLFHLTNRGAKNIDYRPDWSLKENTSNFNSINAEDLELQKLEQPFVLNLPDLILKPNNKKLNPETIRFQFDFTPLYNSSKEIFNVKLGSNEQDGYFLSCKGDGVLELGNLSTGQSNALIKSNAVIRTNEINKLDLQINAKGDFVLILNDLVLSSRNLEADQPEDSKLDPIAGLKNSISISESMRIELIDLSQLQFVEEPIRNTPGLLFRDIAEISLAAINGVVDISDEEIYMRELNITDFSMSSNADGQLGKVNISFPAKLDYSTRIQNLQLFIYLNSNNSIEKIGKSLNKGKESSLDLNLLSKYLKDKFRNNTFGITSLGMGHNNSKQSSIVYEPSSESVKTNGEFYMLTAKTSLRLGPSASERVLLRFSEGDRVDLISKTNVFWWRVQFKGKVGFVKAALLEPEAD